MSRADSGWHQSPGAISPDPSAVRLAEEMVQMDDVMGDILDETIPTNGEAVVHESGRTMCGGDGDIRGPLARYPAAVSLAECPVGSTGGTWHTHVTKDELRRPHNSLPDTANVIFGNIDVSIVSGTQEIDVVMAPGNAEAGVEAFNDALGYGAGSADDVVDAIMDGQIPRPIDARRRVRRRLSPLIDRYQINFPDLDSRLAGSGIPASAPGHSIEFLDAQRFQQHRGVVQRGHTGKNPIRDPKGMRHWGRVTSRQAKQTARTHGVGGTAAGIMIGQAIRALLP